MQGASYYQTPLLQKPGTTSQPPIVTQAQPTRDGRKCICGKDSCDELRQEILKVVPVDHPWRVGNGYTEIRHQSTKKSPSVEALRISCAFHLKLGKDASAFLKYRVANLHWPIVLFKERKRQRACLIDSADAKSYDKMANYAKSRFFNNRNKVGILLKKSDNPAYRQELSTITELYVQAPVCTQAEVKACLKSMTSERAMRRATLAVKTPVRSPSPVPSPSPQFCAQKYQVWLEPTD